MDNRLPYLLTLLPPLPEPGEPLGITLAEAIGRLRQQGGRDLEALAEALEAEALLRESLEEWVLGPPGSRMVPAALPAQLRALFDEARVAALAEDVWVDAVWKAWFDLVADAGRSSGSRLLPHWAAWESGLRQRLAANRGASRAESPPAGPDGDDAPDLGRLLAAWDTARERGREGKGLAAAMEAERLLEQGRLEFLDREAPRYSFTVDELAAYLLKLRLLERQRRHEPARGRELLRQAASL